MPRTVDEEAHSARRNAILDAALQLIYTKGYEQMTIQDLLDALQMSKGAFYHYFDSKPDLLDALTGRIHHQAEAIALPIVHDARLDALTKLERLFATISAWKTLHRAELLPLVPVILSDDNAIFWRKTRAQGIAWLTPLVCEIIRQGVAEGVLQVNSPEMAGQIVLALLFGCGDALVDILLARSPSLGANVLIPVEEFVQVLEAYQDAIERVLGAPSGSVCLADAETLEEWNTGEAPKEASEKVETSERSARASRE